MQATKKGSRGAVALRAKERSALVLLIDKSKEGDRVERELLVLPVDKKIRGGREELAL